MEKSRRMKIRAPRRVSFCVRSCLTSFHFHTNLSTDRTWLTYTTRQGLNGADVDFQTTWIVLETAFREIHTKNASALSFEELYRNAYKLVLKKQGEELYKRVAEFEEQWLGSTVRKEIVQTLSAPLMLSEGAGRTLATANERRQAGEKFLRRLKQSWEDHQVCMGMLTDVLMYMVSGQRHTLLGVPDLIRSRIVCIAPTIDNPQSSPSLWACSAIRSYAHYSAHISSIY